MFTYHKILPFKVLNLVGFKIFTELLYSHCYYLTFESIFVNPKRKPTPISSHSLIPSTATITNLLSLCVDLPRSGHSYRWNHTLCGLCVWLLSFSIILTDLFFKVHGGYRCNPPSWKANIYSCFPNTNKNRSKAMNVKYWHQCVFNSYSIYWLSSLYD